MAQILIDVPNWTETIYKAFIYEFVKTYNPEDLINTGFLKEHSLDSLSRENLDAYKKSLNYKKEDLINI